MVYDPELDLLYVGTGNSSVYNAKFRSPGGGDNLYLSSILALDPDTGDQEEDQGDREGDHAIRKKTVGDEIPADGIAGTHPVAPGCAGFDTGSKRRVRQGIELPLPARQQLRRQPGRGATSGASGLGQFHVLAPEQGAVSGREAHFGVSFIEGPGCFPGPFQLRARALAVSYTPLTLPTILLV